MAPALVVDSAAHDGLKMVQAPSQPRTVRFGSFEVSFPSRELRKHGARVRLPGQPFDILAILIERAGEVVTREELRQRLWAADTFVDFENGMNNAVKKLRAALGDSAERPLYIETLPRVGYRFIAPLDQTNGSASDAHPQLMEMRWKVILPGGIAVLALVAFSYFHFHRAPRLTADDSLVLADFANSTGDPVFDGTLRQGLSVQLEQTPFLRIVSDDQIMQTLRMMEKPPDTKVTHDVAREICERTNATVEVDGSIAAFGSQYVLGLNAVNCASGETLAQEQVTAPSKEKVLVALGTAASELRSKLGESKTSLETYDSPLIEATTSSIDALHVYSQAAGAVSSGDWTSAMASYRRAIEIDPDFALAHDMLGMMSAQFGNTAESHKEIEKAYALRDRTSEYERLAVSASYYFEVLKDDDTAITFFEQWAHTFPRDEDAWAGLAGAYGNVGQYDRALAAAQEALRLNPTAFAYGSTVAQYMYLNRFSDARALLDKAQASHVEPFIGPALKYYLAFCTGDQKGMDAAAGQPWTGATGIPAGSLEDVLGDTQAFYGHLSRARDWSRRAILAAGSEHGIDFVANLAAESAVREALFGDFAQAREVARQIVHPEFNFDSRGGAALALALSGDDDDARKILDDAVRRFPHASYVRNIYAPSVRAAIALHRGDPSEALDELVPRGSYDLASVGALGPMIPVYLRGTAHLDQRDGAAAEAEFQGILDQLGVIANEPIGALAYLGLGRAYALRGDTARARASYEKFLSLWKDADSDVPVLRQAKAEYAKLK